MDIRCRKCERGVLHRRARFGFFETLLSKLGYFPWECSECRKRTMVRKRGPRKLKKTKRPNNNSPEPV